MQSRRERNGRMSVPQFGAWENQGGGSNPSDGGYTMVFTKARADRKEQKAKPILAIPKDNPPSAQPHHRRRRHHQNPDHPQQHRHQPSEGETWRKKNISTYLNCCIQP